MNESIDLRQFRYFVAVCEERHFGRAALRLHISQPPLSRQIRQLEHQLGVQLFTRGKSGIALTDAGAAFLPEVRRTLKQAEKAITTAKASGGTDGGQFVLGYTTVFDRSVIPDMTERLRQQYPHCRLLSKGKHSISLVRDIKNGIMDAAFIGLHTDAPGLSVETIFEEPLVVVLPAQHRLTRKRKLGFDDLQDEAMFWFDRHLNPGYFDHCQAFFDKIGFEPSLVAEPAEHHILLGLIAEGKGLALIPASLQQVKRAGVVFRPLNADGRKLSAGIAVAYAPENPSPVLRHFLKLVRTTGQAHANC
ncbi:MAG TPA: LysR family transcriptional regulator [Telluria sp.]|jgi:DNA-binding transcriptional LysR family regulator